MDYSTKSSLKTGILYAVAAYTTWGFFPLFWKLLQEVPYYRILAHRVVWAAVVFLILAALKYGVKTGAQIRDVLRRYWKVLSLTAFLIGSNWLIYIYAVSTGQIVQSSLGYFINPLMNVFLGMFFLRERLRPAQWFAVALATIGVAQLTIQSDSFPWISISLALTFALYALIRKKAPCEPLIGSTVESLLMAAPLTIYLLFCSPSIPPELPSTAHTVLTLLLLLSGAVTALPLLFFVEAGKRLTLGTLGFLQYVSPSLQLGLAVFLYSEPFTAAHLRSFGFIWIALAIYSLDLVWGFKPKRTQKSSRSN